MKNAPSEVIMSLDDEITKMRKEIKTDSYSMSIGEWISIYENHEIEIHPEFQRVYRWTSYQKTNFIESILLGIPIPPIFVSQREDGIWDVIDGLQRLSTIFHLVGILRDENNKLVSPLSLEKAKYLQSLEGMQWENKGKNKSFSTEQKLLIKRAKISVSIVLRESDSITKYELFQRLNTGGTNLTPQEVRNCIMLMVNPEFHKIISSIAKNPDFQEVIAISQNNLDEQYDVELALRFLVFSNIDINNYDRSMDVGEYLTNEMIKIATDDKYDWLTANSRFKETFKLIRNSLGINAFRRFSDNEFKGGFLLSPFEVIAFGLGFNYPNFPSQEKIIQNVKALYTNETYQSWSGSGHRANSRLPHLIPLGRKLFQP
jgi:uncharacterized protein with ParB-like and HNH nuclease domain